jgi:hypothetical protein
VELRDECRPKLEEVAGDVRIASFLNGTHREDFNVSIGNPPFGLALEFIEEQLRCADVVVNLLRLNFLGSQARAEFHRANRADVFVLPDRPSFTGKGTDSIEYAWFVWYPGLARRGLIHAPTIEVLPLTPESEKKADAGQMGLFL